MNHKEQLPEVKKLVIERLKTIPSDLELHIGSEGNGYTVDELINKVERNDKVGKQLIAVEMEFLRSLKEGTLTNESNPSSN